MGLFDSLFGKKEAPVAETLDGAVPTPSTGGGGLHKADRTDPAMSPAARKHAEQVLRKLTRVGRPGGSTVAEAIALLQQAHGTVEQTSFLDAVLAGIDDSILAEPLRVLGAKILQERGEDARALALVANASTIDGMMLGSDLRAAAGDIAGALSCVERVLARNIDTAGAKERHRRWATHLGLETKSVVNDTAADATMVGAVADEANAYRIVREVARGGAATIYLAHDDALGRPIAYKVFHPGTAPAVVLQEAQMCGKFAGGPMLRIFDVEPDRGGLVAEWAAHGSLRDRIDDPTIDPSADADQWLPALLAKLATIHDAGFLHGDVKPSNVLFRSKDRAIWSDLGQTRPEGEPGGGTLGYLSPERLNGVAATCRDDIYAIGRLVEEVVACHPEGLDHADASSERARLLRLARACLLPAAERPPSARAALRIYADLRPSD